MSYAEVLAASATGTLTIDVNEIDGGTVRIAGYALEPVPEPGTLLLFGLGLVGVVAQRRRIRRVASVALTSRKPCRRVKQARWIR